MAPFLVWSQQGNWVENGNPSKGYLFFFFNKETGSWTNSEEPVMYVVPLGSRLSREVPPMVPASLREDIRAFWNF